jgi:large conductance mechanosensitive channel
MCGQVIMDMDTKDTPRELSAFRKWGQDFAAFIRRGNVVDLAIGVMIGAAFGKIVTSLVTDVITPPLGLVMGKVKFSELKWHLGGPPDAPVTINYGNFLQAALDFLIVAWVLFMVITLVNRLHRKPPPPATALSLDQKLLTEIRDELRSRATARAGEPAATPAASESRRRVSSLEAASAYRPQ